MKTLKDFDMAQFKLKALVIGGSGEGKTYFAGTCPKTFILSLEPGGMDTLLVNPHLKANVVGYEEFIPASPQDTKRCFEALKTELQVVRQMVAKGEVKTVVLDNITYLAENRWVYSETHNAQYSKAGELNKLAMYGDLSRWLYNFVLMELLSIPANVVVTCHEKLESDEVMAKKPDKTSPVVAQIIGGFRDTAEGMFSLVLYLSKLKQGGGYRYYGRTNKGNQRRGKSRFNLPEVVENISYESIVKAISDSVNHKPK